MFTKVSLFPPILLKYAVSLDFKNQHRLAHRGYEEISYSCGTLVNFIAEICGHKNTIHELTRRLNDMMYKC